MAEETKQEEVSVLNSQFNGISPRTKTLLAFGTAILLLVATVAIAYFGNAMFVPNTTNVPLNLVQKETPSELPDGTLYFDYYNSNNHSEYDNGLFVTLRLHNDISSSTYDLIMFTGAQGGVYPVSKLSLYRNTLYFVDKDGQLSSIVAGMRQSDTHAIGLADGEFISDYLFDGDTLYYLAGPFCAVYRGECNNALREFSAETGAVRTIATSIAEHAIAGLDPSRANLYVSYGVGDAGCARTSYKTVQIATGKVSDAMSFQGCGDVDPAEYDAFLAEDRAYTASLIPELTKVNSIQYNKGERTGAVHPNPGYWWMDINVYR